MRFYDYPHEAPESPQREHVRKSIACYDGLRRRVRCRRSRTAAYPTGIDRDGKIDPSIVPLPTADQVLALAPDPASAKSGRELASAAKWVLLGSNDDAIWGECKGSGASPYQTRVELATIGYKCSCPSRKFPCKHVLGLLLLGSAARVPAAPVPDWVHAWLASRREKQDAKPVAKSAKAADPDASAAAAKKRAALREERVALGLDELERWMRDVVRLGLARVQSEPPKFWDAKAARLIDAQAPGLARRVRDLAGIAASGAGWEERMLDAFGALYLLREAYARIDRLAPARRADVRRYIGWTQREEDALARVDASVEDRWCVLGTRSDVDERIVAYRAWLRGERSGRDALVLQFVMPGAPIAHTFAPGTAFDGRVAYFEASVPQRVAIVERSDGVESALAPAARTVDAALAAYAACVARDPWFVAMPACIAVAQLIRSGDDWFVCDGERNALPLAKSSDAVVLHALCGGHPIVVAGEWDGRAFLPLGSWADGRFVALS
jgi:hypothetical protein